MMLRSGLQMNAAAAAAAMLSSAPGLAVQLVREV
jgi:hypothetical protein